MKNLYLFPLIFLIGGCVKSKIYRTELAKRNAAETRETMLIQELAARKTEAASLIDRTAELAKNVGRQETEITQLKTQLSTQSTSATNSSAKILEEKIRLEKDLAEKNAQLATRNARISGIEKAQKLRDTTLQKLQNEIAGLFQQSNFWAVSTILDGATVRLTLPDSLIFEEKGLTVGTRGLPILQIIGSFLASKPDLQTQIIAYTDNILPKEKGLVIRDSRDWSLLRANVVGRVLTREFNVNDNQLSLVGRGEFFPVASNSTPEGRAENRRTEVVFHPILVEIPKK